MSTDNNIPTRRVLLDAAGAADFLGVTERWVRRAILEKRCPYVKLGRQVRFEPEALERWLAQQRVEPTR